MAVLCCAALQGPCDGAGPATIQRAAPRKIQMVDGASTPCSVSCPCNCCLLAPCCLAHELLSLTAADLPAPPRPKVSKPRADPAVHHRPPQQQQQQQHQRPSGQAQRRPSGGKRPAQHRDGSSSSGQQAQAGGDAATVANSRFERWHPQAPVRVCADGRQGLRCLLPGAQLGATCFLAHPAPVGSCRRLERGVISGDTWSLDEVRAGPDSEVVEIPAKFGSFEVYPPGALALPAGSPLLRSRALGLSLGRLGVV